MKLYVDSAIISEIAEISSWGVLSGVTTNPTLVAQASKSSGQGFRETIIQICDIVKGPVSAEVTAEDAEGMIKQGKDFAHWDEMVVVKLPCTPEGLKACRALSNSGIPTNLTLCFSVNQALLCARAGAKYVSPFIGRLEDINENGVQLIRDIKEVFKAGNIKTEIIAASVRTPYHVTDVAKAGADIATIPYKLFANMIKHPLTDSGLARFLADWKASGASI
ncbi:MAG: fructose-6-phosphate aldolase [Candidatus Caenarcaniphilales bacterium]|nr:fructose-6-phosphate aldolase [Candidatus Caenarcaniphilales bacterium]